jgi:hypothetical protein
MKSYLLTFLLALLVVLTVVTLRRSLAAIGRSAASGPANTTAIGVSPVPLPPTIAIGFTGAAAADQEIDGARKRADLL